MGRRPCRRKGGNLKRFALLYRRLQDCKSAEQKLPLLTQYFREARGEDAAWALRLLLGPRPKRSKTSDSLRKLAIDTAGVPEWLFDESLKTVGDLAETISLILPKPDLQEDQPLSQWIAETVEVLSKLPPRPQADVIRHCWSMLDENGRLAFNRLITGTFRASVSEDLAISALSQATGVSIAGLSQRLAADWRPSKAFYEGLVGPEKGEAQFVKPRAYSLAEHYEVHAGDLGNVAEWQAEWKLDGVRAQLIARDGQCFLWTQMNTLITDKFPEVARMIAFLPESISLDGELVAWSADSPVSRSHIERRIERRAGAKGGSESIVPVFVAFDILELNGEDLCGKPFVERRAILNEAFSIAFPESSSTHAGVHSRQDSLALSSVVNASDWQDLIAQAKGARAMGLEGLILKRRAAGYGEERWQSWDCDPLRIHAVLVYAERTNHGHSLYTFGVWSADALVPIAKTAAGLSEAETAEIDRFVLENTLERFGPVRTVQPTFVMELEFAAIEPSSRHKAGVILRSPVIRVWRRDANPQDAHTLEVLKRLIPGQ